MSIFDILERREAWERTRGLTARRCRISIDLEKALVRELGAMCTGPALLAGVITPPPPATGMDFQLDPTLTGSAFEFEA